MEKTIRAEDFRKLRGWSFFKPRHTKFTVARFPNGRKRDSARASGDARNRKTRSYLSRFLSNALHGKQKRRNKVNVTNEDDDEAGNPMRHGASTARAHDLLPTMILPTDVVTLDAVTVRVNTLIIEEEDEKDYPVDKGKVDCFKDDNLDRLLENVTDTYSQSLTNSTAISSRSILQTVVSNRKVTNAGSDEFGVLLTVPFDSLDISISSPATTKTTKLSSSTSTLLDFLKTLMLIIDHDTIPSTRGFNKAYDKDNLFGNTTTATLQSNEKNSKAIDLKNKPSVVTSTQTNFPSACHIQQQEFPSNFVKVLSTDGLLSKIECTTTQPPYLTSNTQVYNIQQQVVPFDFIKFLATNGLAPTVGFSSTQTPDIAFQQHAFVTTQRPNKVTCLKVLLQAVSPRCNVTLSFLNDLPTQAQKLVDLSTFHISTWSSASSSARGILGLELEESTPPMHSRSILSVKRQSEMEDLHLINRKKAPQSQEDLPFIFPISSNSRLTTQSSYLNDSSTELSPATGVYSSLSKLSTEDSVCSYSFIYPSQVISEENAQLLELTTPGIDYVISKMMANKTVIEYLIKVLKSSDEANRKLSQSPTEIILSSSFPTEITSPSSSSYVLSTASTNLNSNSQDTFLFSSSTRFSTVQKQYQSLEASLPTTNSQIASDSTLNASPSSVTSISSDVTSTSSSLNTMSSKLVTSTSQQANWATLLTTTSTKSFSTVGLENSTQTTAIKAKRLKLNSFLSHVQGESMQPSDSMVRSRQPGQYANQVQLPPRILPGRLFETFRPEPFMWRRKYNSNGWKLNTPRTISRETFTTLPISKVKNFGKSIRRSFDSNRGFKYSPPLDAKNDLAAFPKTADTPDLVVYRMPSGGIEQLEAPFVELNRNKLRLPIRIRIPFENNRLKTEKYKMQFPRLAQYYDNWQFKKPGLDIPLYNQLYNLKEPKSSIIGFEEMSTTQIPKFFLGNIPKLLTEITTSRSTVGSTSQTIPLEPEIFRRLASLVSAYYKNSTIGMARHTASRQPKSFEMNDSTSTHPIQATYLPVTSKFLRLIDVMPTQSVQSTTTQILKWNGSVTSDNFALTAFPAALESRNSTTFSPFMILPNTTTSLKEAIIFNCKLGEFVSETCKTTSPPTSKTTRSKKTRKSTDTTILNNMTRANVSTEAIMFNCKLGEFVGETTQPMTVTTCKTTPLPTSKTTRSKKTRKSTDTTILNKTTKANVSTEANIFNCSLGESVGEATQLFDSKPLASKIALPVSRNAPYGEISTLLDQTKWVANSNSPKITPASISTSWTGKSITSKQEAIPLPLVTMPAFVPPASGETRNANTMSDSITVTEYNNGRDFFKYLSELDALQANMSTTDTYGVVNKAVRDMLVNDFADPGIHLVNQLPMGYNVEYRNVLPSLSLTLGSNSENTRSDKPFSRDAKREVVIPKDVVLKNLFETNDTNWSFFKSGPAIDSNLLKWGVVNVKKQNGEEGSSYPKKVKETEDQESLISPKGKPSYERSFDGVRFMPKKQNSGNILPVEVDSFDETRDQVSEAVLSNDDMLFLSHLAYADDTDKEGSTKTKKTKMRVNYAATTETTSNTSYNLDNYDPQTTFSSTLHNGVVTQCNKKINLDSSETVVPHGGAFLDFLGFNNLERLTTTRKNEKILFSPSLTKPEDIKLNHVFTNGEFEVENPEKRLFLTKYPMEETQSNYEFATNNMRNFLLHYNGQTTEKTQWLSYLQKVNDNSTQKQFVNQKAFVNKDKIIDSVIKNLFIFQETNPPPSMDDVKLLPIDYSFYELLKKTKKGDQSMKDKDLFDESHFFTKQSQKEEKGQTEFLVDEFLKYLVRNKSWLSRLLNKTQLHTFTTAKEGGRIQRGKAHMKKEHALKSTTEHIGQCGTRRKNKKKGSKKIKLLATVIFDMSTTKSSAQADFNKERYNPCDYPLYVFPDAQTKDTTLHPPIDSSIIQANDTCHSSPTELTMMPEFPEEGPANQMIFQAHSNPSSKFNDTLNSMSDIRSVFNELMHNTIELIRTGGSLLKQPIQRIAPKGTGVKSDLSSSHKAVKPATTSSYLSLKSDVNSNNELENKIFFQKLIEILNQPYDFIDTEGDIQSIPNHLRDNGTQSSSNSLIGYYEKGSNALKEPYKIVTSSNTVVRSTFSSGTTNSETTRDYIPTKSETKSNRKVENTIKQPLPQISSNPSSKHTTLHHTKSCTQSTPNSLIGPYKKDSNSSKESYKIVTSRTIAVGSTFSGGITNSGSTRDYIPTKSETKSNRKVENTIKQPLPQLSSNPFSKHTTLHHTKSGTQSTTNSLIGPYKKDSNLSKKPYKIVTSKQPLPQVFPNSSSKYTDLHHTKCSTQSTSNFPIDEETIDIDSNESEQLDQMMASVVEFTIPGEIPDITTCSPKTSSYASKKEHKFNSTRNGIEIIPNHVKDNETEPSSTVVESVFSSGITESGTTSKRAMSKSNSNVINKVNNTVYQPLLPVSLNPSINDLKKKIEAILHTPPYMMDNTSANSNLVTLNKIEISTQASQSQYQVYVDEDEDSQHIFRLNSTSTDVSQTLKPTLINQDEVSLSTTEDSKSTCTEQQSPDLIKPSTKKELENTNTITKSVQEANENKLDYFTAYCPFSDIKNQPIETTTTQKSKKLLQTSHRKGLKKFFSNLFKKRKHKSTSEPNIKEPETPFTFPPAIDLELEKNETESEPSLKATTECTTLIFNMKVSTVRAALKHRLAFSSYSPLLNITEPPAATKTNHKKKVKARNKSARLQQMRRLTHHTEANIAPLGDDMLMPKRSLEKRSTKVETVRNVTSIDFESIYQQLRDIIGFLRIRNVYSQTTLSMQSKKEATSSSTVSEELLTTQQTILDTSLSIPVNLTDATSQNTPLNNATSDTYNLEISLPVYALNSTAMVESYEKYYSNIESSSSRIIDDEATDTVLNYNAFRSMKYEDFLLVTEFAPMTTADAESHATFSNMSSMEVSKIEEAADITHNESFVTNSEILPPFVWNDLETTAINTVATQTTNPVDLDEFGNRFTNGTIMNATTSFSLGEFTSFLTTGLPYDLFTNLKTYFTNLSNISTYSTCQLSDYQARNNCICSIDSLIKDLRTKISNNPMDINMDSYSCPILNAISNGVIVGNESIPQIAKTRRGIFNYFEFVEKRDVIENRNIEKALNEQFDVKNTGTEIFATSGEKIEIPCFDPMKETSGKITKYDWTFTDNQPLTESKVQESGGTLIIENLSSQDDGNYTCTVKLDNNDYKKYEHHLSILSLPTYTISATLVYNSTNKCEDADLDILSLYFPNVFGSLLCGDYFKACKIEVQSPSCSNEHTAINMSVLIEPINVIMPLLNTVLCDFNCQMRIYTRIVQFVVYNLESLEKIPVYFRLSFRKQALHPIMSLVKKANHQAVTELPKLNVACPPGFGYHRKPHVCGSCLRNTFSRGEETRCIDCPAGQYQPMVGSKSCLKCTNPLQDPYCLRIVYSNAQNFTIIVTLFIFAVVIIVMLICCCSSRKRHKDKYTRNEYYKSKKKRHQRDVDVENQDQQPLLNQPKIKKSRGRKPPKPPPPDFF